MISGIKWKWWIFVGATPPTHKSHLSVYGTHYKFKFKYLFFGVWVRWGKEPIMRGA